MTLQPVGKADPEALTVVTDILRNRIDSLGVAEPEITRQGNTVIVNLPGVKDQDRAIQLVGQTGKVLLPARAGRDARPRPWRPPRPARPRRSPARRRPAPDASATTVAPSTTVATTTASRLEHHRCGHARPQRRRPRWRRTVAAPDHAPGARTRPDASRSSCPGEGRPDACYQLGPAFALGEDAISTAAASVQNGQWVVDLKLKDGAKGLEAWNTWASKCYSQEADCPTGGMAIVLDGTVDRRAGAPDRRSSPTPDVQVSGGGNGFQKSEAKDLARVLKYGALPVELKPQAAQTVSATLGKDSLHAGLIAGFVGVAARAAPDDPLLPDARPSGRGRAGPDAAACCGPCISVPRRRPRASP